MSVQSMEITQSSAPDEHIGSRHHELRLEVGKTTPTSDNPIAQPCVRLVAKWGGNVIGFELIHEEVAPIRTFLESFLRRYP